MIQKGYKSRKVIDMIETTKIKQWIYTRFIINLINMIFNKGSF